jgi:hypothetical protein
VWGGVGVRRGLGKREGARHTLLCDCTAAAAHGNVQHMSTCCAPCCFIMHIHVCIYTQQHPSPPPPELCVPVCLSGSTFAGQLQLLCEGEWPLNLTHDCAAPRWCRYCRQSHLLLLLPLLRLVQSPSRDAAAAAAAAASCCIRSC